MDLLIRQIKRSYINDVTQSSFDRVFHDYNCYQCNKLKLIDIMEAINLNLACLITIKFCFASIMIIKNKLKIIIRSISFQ